MGTYCNAELCFVQEEHKNMGAWSYVQPRTQTAIGGYHRLIQYIGRETAPSPATGSKATHKKELSAFLAQAMALKRENQRSVVSSSLGSIMSIPLSYIHSTAYII